MTLAPPQPILEALSTHEAVISPLSEIELQTSLRRALASIGEISKDERKGAWAETAAFHFVAADTDDRSPWGSYFRPIKTAVNQDGTISYSPNAADIDESVLEYWEERASSTTHPVLRARYADLAWEFGKRMPNADSARGFAWPAIAIDSYLDAVQQFLIEHEPQAWRFLDRAIELALAIPDPARLKRAKTALFAYYREQQRLGQVTMWWMPDQIAHNRSKIDLSASETQELLVGLEAQLSLHANHGDTLRYDPGQILSAADRLIHHRRRLDQPRQAVRTMKLAGAAIERAAMESLPRSEAVKWLMEVLRRYQELEMHDEVARASGNLAQQRAKLAELASTGSGVERAEHHTWLERLVAGTLDESLNRAASAFLVSESLVCERGDSAMSGAGESADFTTTTIRNACALMTQKASLLSVSLERIKQRHTLDVAKMVAFLGPCNYFEIVRRRFLQDGLQAWLIGDTIKAVYILIPEIEAALRHALSRMGGATSRSSGSGPFVPLDAVEVLQSSAMKRDLDRNVRLHLLSLYGRGTGGSLGDQLARGTVSYDEIDSGLGDWVVHSALLVAKFAPGCADKAESPSRWTGATE